MVLDIVGLSISVPEFILTIISFFLFMFLMKKVLYDPILKVMDARKAKIESGHEEGKAAQKALDERKAELAAQFSQKGDEARALISEAKAEAEAEKGKLLGIAHTEAEELHKAVRQKLSTEELEATEAIDSDMPELVGLLTGRLLQSELSSEDIKLIRSCTDKAED